MLKICDGTVPAPHDKIVYSDGGRWHTCPLCTAIEEHEVAERKLAEARERIVVLESGASV